MIEQAQYLAVGPGLVAWVPVGMIPLPIYANGDDAHTMYHQQTIFCKDAWNKLDVDLRASLDRICTESFLALAKKDGWEKAGPEYNKFMAPLRQS